MNNSLKKPCLVPTSQGFSVSYNDKFLYSKYSPSKAILQQIDSLQILPGTLFLCYSPCLGYGLNELLAKLQDGCFCLLCEIDPELLEFQHQNLQLLSNNHKIAELTQKELFNLPSILNSKSYTTINGITLPECGTFKRIVRIDFSAGIQFHQDFYNELYTASTNAIITFWSNRMTLTKFGRKYSLNLFRNLKILSKTVPIQNYFNSVSKPIVVFGAGESTNEGIEKLKKAKEHFYIICADTALQPLLKNNITPDAVFIEEAQSVIKKAFIGTRKADYHIFAGLSAVTNLNLIQDFSQISFFTTLYAQTNFLDNLLQQHIIPPSNPPFGSVGLTAVYYALQFRSTESIPVYVYGLDFSYSVGVTHAKGTLAHTNQLIKSTKIMSVDNFKAAFNPTSFKITDKNGNTFFTTRTLQNYAVIFNSLFCEQKNLYDASKSGIKLNIPQKDLDVDNNICKQTPIKNEFVYDALIINNFLQQEIEALEYLKSLLTGKIVLSQEELQIEIKKIASPREYLYLHFPDGWQFNNNLSFLKRIRTEIDFFLKFMKD